MNHEYHSRLKPRRKRSENTQTLFILFSAACLTVLLWAGLRTGQFGFSYSTSTTGYSSRRLTNKDGTLKTDTLVVYIFSDTDPEYINNLYFFARFGMSEEDGCDYVIVIQDDEEKATPPLPTLPKNARYVHHTNKCYDWGSIGWVFDNRLVDPDNYTYFIFMNSSVRGPFVPPHLRNLVRWQDLLIEKLNDKIALVGPTISCEGSPYQGNVAGEWRSNPHVQSYVLATDKRGIAIWMADKNVFECWTSMWDVIWHGELGSSLAVLNAGYGLDSFMMRYQGIDWTDSKNWGCNKQANPYGEHYYDGISLNPFEVMFVKVKERVLQNDWSFAVQAQKYTGWMEAQEEGVHEITSNIYKTDPGPINAPRLAYMRMRGPDCFDAEYYTEKNPDIRLWKTKEELWGHFLRVGAYEGRAFKFTCEPAF
jgi:hypothetical protein